MSDDIAIKVDHVSKSFKLPHEKQTSIKGAIINRLKGGKRSFERQQVLNDVSFEIKKGEFFGIIGRNGSGKSTLLKMLAGIYTPTKGSIQVNGKLTPFIELGVGFNPELTGRENVYLNGSLLGFNRKEMNAMYDDIVSFAELERFMDQKLKNYSSGMQVRLAFSIAIRAQSDILVLDEVLAVGDINFQEKCYEVFKQIKKSGKTIVFVSHDLASMEEFCDRVALIDKGEQIGVGNPNEMILQYESRMAGKVDEKNSSNVEQINRPGTGHCRISSVELINSDGKKADFLKKNEKFSINVKYGVNQPFEKMVCGISIEDGDGVSILGPNTGDAKFVLTKDILATKGTITAQFDENVLVPGVYTVSVGLFDGRGAVPYDFFTKALSFKIIGKALHGKVTIEPVWSVSKTT